MSKSINKCLAYMAVGIGFDEYLSISDGSHDWHGPGVQSMVRLRKLVPWHEASYTAGDEQDHEG